MVKFLLSSTKRIKLLTEVLMEPVVWDIAGVSVLEVWTKPDDYQMSARLAAEYAA